MNHIRMWFIRSLKIGFNNNDDWIFNIPKPSINYPQGIYKTNLHKFKKYTVD